MQYIQLNFDCSNVRGQAHNHADNDVLWRRIFARLHLELEAMLEGMRHSVTSKQNFGVL